MRTALLSLLLFGLAGCKDDPNDSATDASDSHAKGAPADYARIFADDRVHRLDIQIDPTVYEEMEADMTVLYGPFGEGSQGPPPEGGGGPPQPTDAQFDACDDNQHGDPCSYMDPQGQTVNGNCIFPPENNQDLLCMPPPPDGGGGGGGPGPGSRGEPGYFPVKITYDGDVWEHVGMRYKGNSSLNSSWPRGNHKLPFRLDFDEFEDTYPETEDQRFWGFKKLTFASNFFDESFLREKICGDLFRDGGVPTAESAFYRVFIDAGGGPVYWGLYTMVEDPSNKMLDTQFSDGSGNLYKPEGSGADWRQFSEQGFDKKTNEEEADYSDIIAAIDALHDRSLSDEQWRSGLEEHLDVDGFIRWLAIHVIQQNWDAYGRSPHNYYLYGDPSDGGRLVWIPWDLNEAMTDEASNSRPLTLPLDDLDDRAPLISYLMEDPIYAAQYRDELRNAVEGTYALGPLHEKMERYHEMIAPYVIGPEGEQEGYTSLQRDEEFEQSLQGGRDALIDLSERRHADVEAYLGGSL